MYTGYPSPGKKWPERGTHQLVLMLRINTAIRHFVYSAAVKLTLLNYHSYFPSIYFNIIAQNKHNSAK